ncbi:hypothetical protein K431DRAFT_234997 [Polychaeton citri CBS 116435]|uniref:Uncharacterized protein n=1 Tax=Polychaeton citri CBS 116435 TaxID=1314669 RepID=A0A9P4UJP7_9PEZI|nr:hypothetical protein K431DRAFT_234997 [Polychaeton citri CBS 116435]
MSLSPLPPGPYTGDDLLPEAPMVYDQTRTVNTSRADVWPWVVQLGKGRGGWYCPSSWERRMPVSWRASRSVEARWQGLAVGDRVADYGFSADDYFDVAVVEPERALVYRSDRYGASFSWSLLLHEVEGPGGEGAGATVRTVVHLRFRGKIAAQGLKKRLIVWGGGILDHLTTAPMLAGLAERAEGKQAN